MTGLNWYVAPKTAEICLTRKEGKIECSEGEFLALLQEVCRHYSLQLIRIKAPPVAQVNTPGAGDVDDEGEDAEEVEVEEDVLEEEAPVKTAPDVPAAKKVLERLEGGPQPQKKRALRV